jgi:glycerol-3-phosphate dehydrogenase (NAD(P)+)
VAGTLKNVIALGSGMCEGMGYGYNTIAGLIVRGAKEI